MGASGDVCEAVLNLGYANNSVNVLAKNSTNEAEKCSVVCRHHNLLMALPMNGYLDCLYTFAIINKATLGTYSTVFLCS
ncbi:hypothetical protein STEG23_000735 [Scotinomys teguina]